MEQKRMHKFFALPDFIEEEQFLMEQHKKGWKFIKFNSLSKYTFEKTEPEEYIYQLDYKEEGDDEDSYIQLFVDCGWEYLMNTNQFYYFRKKKDGAEDISIFSDVETRLEMCKRVLKRQSTLFLTLLPLLYVTIFARSEIQVFSFFLTAVLILAGVLHLRNFLKLNRMVRQLAS